MPHKIKALRFLAVLLPLIAGVIAFEMAVHARALSGPGESRPLRLAHATPADFAYHHAAESFAHRVEELSRGRLSVEVFPNGQLGSEQTYLDSLALGTLDLAIVNQAYTSSYVVPFGFLSMAYLFEDGEHARRTVFDPNFLAVLDREVAGTSPGFAYLATLPCGVRSLYATKPLRDFASLRGRKIRIMPSEIETRVWSAFGCHTLSVPFGDVYSALQTDLAEGAENTPSAYASSRHSEVAPYFILTKHQHLTANFLISARTLARLDEEDRQMLRQAALEACRIGADAAEKADAEALENLAAAHKITVIEVDRTPFREAVAPLHTSLARSMGAEELLRLAEAFRSPTRPRDGHEPPGEHETPVAHE